MQGSGSRPRASYVILTLIVLALLSAICRAAALLPVAVGRRVLGAIAPLGSLAVLCAQRGWRHA